MINALRYEPRGQHQRYEPREQQNRELEQRQFHLHLNVHMQLNLGARTRARRGLQPTTASVTAIFAAFIGALSMALSFSIMSVVSFHFMGPHIDLATNIMTIGALLGSGAILLGGIPLLVSAWRSSPRSRILLLTPFLLALTGFLLAFLYNSLPHVLQSFLTGAPLLAFFFYGFPLISTIAIVRGIRKAPISEKVLRFTTIPSYLVVGGLLLMIGGMLLWGGTVAFFLPEVFPQILALLTLPVNSWLLQLMGMLIALVVMLWTLFSRSHVRNQVGPRPKDASPSDVAAARSRGYYPVDGNNE